MHPVPSEGVGVVLYSRVVGRRSPGRSGPPVLSFFLLFKKLDHSFTTIKIGGFVVSHRFGPPHSVLNLSTSNFLCSKSQCSRIRPTEVDCPFLHGSSKRRLPPLSVP